ncbi:MAG TPA: TatD family hydrolase, partial [Aggregatilineales bacterium]|nr:TatD family hydrolase [Aggregatilineales bacterium]
MSALIDTHCHLNAEQYDSDREEVIMRAQEAGVTRVIIPAVDVPSGDTALALSASHEGIFAAVGI